MSEFMGWICRGVETQKTPARGEHWGLLIEADALSGRISRQASKLVRWAGREPGYSGVTSVEGKSAVAGPKVYSAKPGVVARKGSAVLDQFLGIVWPEDWNPSEGRRRASTVRV